MRYPTLALLSVVLMCHGCVSTTAQGALWGAGAGALAGVTIGHVVSDEKLLGSPMTDGAGDMSLPADESRLVGLLVGAAFGSIVGGIFGHISEDPLQDAYEAEKAARAESLANLGGDLDLGDEDLDDEDLDDEDLDDETDDEDLDDEADGEELDEADGDGDGDGASEDDSDESEGDLAAEEDDDLRGDDL